MNDQDGLAALMANLDLVISAGTAVDSLAGALGRPAWVLTRDVGDWWGLGTGRCPWSPGVRTFHCEASSPWEPAIARMAEELRLLRDGRLAEGAAAVDESAGTTVLEIVTP